MARGIEMSNIATSKTDSVDMICVNAHDQQEVKVFVRDVTLYLQSYENRTRQQVETMFQRAYNIYCLLDVENRQKGESKNGQ
jgi:hypothetical protein